MGVQVLVDRGPTLNGQDKTIVDGWTPLKYASSLGHVALVKLLLKRRASVDIESGWMHGARRGAPEWLHGGGGAVALEGSSRVRSIDPVVESTTSKFLACLCVSCKEVT